MTGFGYLSFGQQIGAPPVGGWFVTMGLLGAASLIVLGFGQWVAGPRTRVFLLVVLHRAGLWLGAALFLGVLLEAMFVIQAQRSVEERAV